MIRRPFALWGVFFVPARAILQAGAQSTPGRKTPSAIDGGSEE